MLLSLTLAMPARVFLPLHPVHPERVCWGCDKLCPADALTCGNGTERQAHPAELFGDDWAEWAREERREATPFPSPVREPSGAPDAADLASKRQSRAPQPTEA
jgi:hypothetical protein